MQDENNEAVYLGVKFSANGKVKRELDGRIGKAMFALGALKRNV